MRPLPRNLLHFRLADALLQVHVTDPGDGCAPSISISDEMDTRKHHQALSRLEKIEREIKMLRNLRR